MEQKPLESIIVKPSKFVKPSNLNLYNSNLNKQVMIEDYCSNPID